MAYANIEDDALVKQPNGCLVSIPGIRLHVSKEQTTTLEVDSGNVRYVLVPAARAGLHAKHPDAIHQEMLKDRSGSTTVGWAIKKLPFKVVFRPMSGNRSTAVAAGSDSERPLRPMTCQSAVASNDRCTLQPAIDPLTARSAATVALRADAPQHQMVRNLAVVSLAKWLQSSA